MKKLSVKQEGHKFSIYSDDHLYGEIIYDDNNLEASLTAENKTWRAERGTTKDMVLKEDGQTLFTFKFDYIWGGAEIVANGAATGYEIIGRWFKPGTRLTNDDDDDLVVAVKKNDGLEVTIMENETSAMMIMATIFYHIYASRGKMRWVLNA